jgi:hypothetical protein
MILNIKTVACLNIKINDKMLPPTNATSSSFAKRFAVSCCGTLGVIKKK